MHCPRDWSIFIPWIPTQRPLKWSRGRSGLRKRAPWWNNHVNGDDWNCRILQMFTDFKRRIFARCPLTSLGIARTVRMGCSAPPSHSPVNRRLVDFPIREMCTICSPCSSVLNPFLTVRWVCWLSMCQTLTVLTRIKHWHWPRWKLPRILWTTLAHLIFWTARFGWFLVTSNVSIANPGSAYSNIGDWQAIYDSLLKAVRYGESSVGAVDFGLLGYVCPLCFYLLTWQGNLIYA